MGPPRPALRPTTTPLITGRSVVAPVSPLLVAPVVIVIRQARGQRVHAAEVDLPRQDVHAAQHEALALIEDGIAVFNVAGEVGIVGILAGGVRVHVIDGVRPRVARQHLQLPAEAMAQVHIERVVKGVAIVHVALDHGIGRLRIGGR